MIKKLHFGALVFNFGALSSALGRKPNILNFNFDFVFEIESLFMKHKPCGLNETSCNHLHQHCLYPVEGKRGRWTPTSVQIYV